MISTTKVVISNEILNSPNCGVEGSHSPNEQDSRYNQYGFRAKYSRKITADFLWGKGQLSLHPTFPEKDAQISPDAVCTLLSAKLHQNWNKLRWFSSSFLYLLHIKIYISFFSFLFIFLFLDAQKCLTSRVLMTSPWASKSVKQIDDAFSICAIAASPKGANASFKSCTINRGGPPLYPTRWHIRGSWQLVKCLCCLWNSA